MKINQQHFSRRQFLQMAGSVVSLATLTACTPSEDPVVPPVEMTEILFWGHDQHPIDLAAEGFTQKYPNMQWVSPHPVDRVDAIVTKMAEGSGAPDLYWAEATEAQAWGCTGLLTDLTDYLQPFIDQYHPLKVAETVVAKRGRQVGWPGDITVSGWHYREDKLQAAGYGGVDWANITWPDFLGVAAELAKQELYLYCFPATGWAALFFFALHQVGGTAVSQDGQTLTVGDERGIAAMQIVKALWDAGGGYDVEWWGAEYWAALREGKLIGDFASAWSRSFWEANLRSAEDQSALGHWRVAPLPGGPGTVNRTGVWGGGQLITPKAATNTEAAILYMQYALGSEEGAALCGQSDMTPAYRPYLVSNTFREQRSAIFGDWSFGQFWADQEKQLSPAYFRPVGWDAVNTTVSNEMTPILLGEISVEEGMARIVEVATPDFERTRCA